MPSPKTLRVGDRIKYVHRPTEWERPRFRIDPWDIQFIDRLIQRGRWQRIAWIDEYRHPWIRMRLRVDDAWEHHTWAVFESTGWIRKHPRGL